MKRMTFLMVVLGMLVMATPAWPQTANTAQTLWGLGHQMGALHMALFRDDAAGARTNLQNVLTLLRELPCLDATPWQSLMLRLNQGTPARALFSEMVALSQAVPSAGPLLRDIARCYRLVGPGGPGGLGAGPSTPVPPPLPDGACRGFAGTWDGGGGLVLQLTVDGSQARGIYRDPRGWQGEAYLTGTVRGNVLEGEWFNPLLRGNSRNRGPVRFELSADGQRFAGAWREADGAPGGLWNGTCIGAAPLAPVPVPQPAVPSAYSFGGSWYCGGTLEVFIEQSGDRISGTYIDPGGWRGQASLSGVARGSLLEGQWFNQAYRGNTNNRGPIRFEMNADGMTWSGYWREANGQGGGSWNCTRRASR